MSTVSPANVNPLECSAVTAACPVEASIYGYYPSLAANSFFAGFFGLFFLLNVAFLVRYRTYTFSLVLCLGTLAECIGYVGRILLHANPFSSAGFEMQICCLIIAPAFLSGAIYLTLKHLVLEFGESASRIRPYWYTWFFITADVLALLFQAAGGAMAASSGTNSSLLTIGSNLMLTGIVWQVATLFVFGCLATDYIGRRSRTHKSGAEPLSPSAQATLAARKFRFFAAAVFLAFFAVEIRCVYRIAEMARGWKNPVMQNEADFIVLDGVMVVLATFALTIFHPGYCFPRLSNTIFAKKSATSSVERPGLPEKQVSSDSQPKLEV